MASVSFSREHGCRKAFFGPICVTAFGMQFLPFSLNTAGYTGEILRGAMMAVPKGEIEAARAFGFFVVFDFLACNLAARHSDLSANNGRRNDSAFESHFARVTDHSMGSDGYCAADPENNISRL